MRAIELVPPAAFSSFEKSKKDSNNSCRPGGGGGDGIGSDCGVIGGGVFVIFGGVVFWGATDRSTDSSDGQHRIGAD